MVWKEGSNQRNFGVYLFKGDGTFGGLINTTTAGFAPDISGCDRGQCADVNGDGLADYTVSLDHNGKRALVVHLSKGDGTFKERVYTESNGNFLLDSLGRDRGMFINANEKGRGAGLTCRSLDPI